jgi:hypothetical protein
MMDNGYKEWIADYEASIADSDSDPESKAEVEQKNELAQIAELEQKTDPEKKTDSGQKEEAQMTSKNARDSISTGVCALEKP